MRRLRDLAIGLGHLPTGPGNRISDVGGVRVGAAHLISGGPAAVSGMTAVLPYTGAEERKLFIGRWSLDRGDSLTGLGVAEDFGLFSAPICLVPRPLVGQVYNAAIGYGLERDTGLSIGMGWPPVVLGIDERGSAGGGANYAKAGIEALLRQVLSAPDAAVAEGTAGIGQGLGAFGVQGGVGTASRQVGTALVGALVAVNGGEPQNLCVDRYPIGPALDLAPAPPGARSFVGVVATDAPLIPRQLDRLAGRAALGLARVGLLDEQTKEGVILAFSTAVPQELEDGPVEMVELSADTVLSRLFAAAAEACEESVLNALLAATPVKGAAAVLPTATWPELVRDYQRGKRG